jgi:GNAT superfamily N-acetyltransferase
MRSVALVTLVHLDGSASAPAVPAGYLLRPCHADDIEELGRLYFHSYDPGQACASLPEAISDIHATFAGAYGELWPAASLVATTHEQHIVAAIQIVERAPWPDTPDCPFAIELFTARAHRRHGIARSLILGALNVIARTGRPQLALRVSPDNHPAVTLYRDLGFQDWNVTDPQDTT